MSDIAVQGGNSIDLDSAGRDENGTEMDGNHLYLFRFHTFFGIGNPGYENGIEYYRNRKWSENEPARI
jgi:hypothetical protein